MPTFFTRLPLLNQSICFSIVPDIPDIWPNINRIQPWNKGREPSCMIIFWISWNQIYFPKLQEAKKSFIMFSIFPLWTIFQIVIFLMSSGFDWLSFSYFFMEFKTNPFRVSHLLSEVSVHKNMTDYLPYFFIKHESFFLFKGTFSLDFSQPFIFSHFQKRKSKI